MFNSKKLLASLLAFFLLAAPATPQGWLPLAESVATPVSNACSTSSGTTITFTAQGIGGANPNRVSVVSINWDDSTNAGTASITAVTIGGISMIKAVSALSGAQNSNSEIWYVSNPTGTSANIVITAATAINGVTIEVYSLVGFVTAPGGNTVGTTSVSQGYNNKQLALAAGSRQINVSTSLSNMVNDFSSACGANLWGVHASQRLSGNNGTLTSTISPTSNTPLIALAIWTSGTTVPGSCAQSTAFLARTSGLDTTHTNAYNSLICGLVTDGIFSKFDFLQIYATQDQTTALLNLVSTNFTSTLAGPPTFTVDRGFTSTLSSSIRTGFTPSTAGGVLTLNSAHISFWSNTSSGACIYAIGVHSGGYLVLGPNFSPNGFYTVINENTGFGAANTDTLGHFLGNRSASNAEQSYKNGTSFTSSSIASTSLPTMEFWALGYNEGGFVNSCPYQTTMASAGSSLTAGEVTSFYNRLRTYMTAVGVP